MRQNLTYEIVGVACGLGSDNRETSGAPAIVRSAGLVERLRRLGFSVVDGSDIALPTGTSLDEGSADPKLRNLDAMKLLAARMIPALTEVYARGNCPIVIGGDHALSMVSVSVAAEVLRRRRGPEARLGVLWVDAHGDLNTPETTPSGNLHGMPAAVLLGRG